MKNKTKESFFSFSYRFLFLRTIQIKKERGNKKRGEIYFNQQNIRKKKKKIRATEMPIIRVTIMEMPSAVCIFDKILPGWHGKEEGTGNDKGGGLVCSMIMSIVKLGKEIGQAEPLYMVFDNTAALLPGVVVGKAGPARNKTALKGFTKQEIRGPVRVGIKIGKNIGIIVFHDYKKDPEAQVDAFIQQSLDAFEKEFGDTLNGMRDDFDKIEKSEGSVQLTQEQFNQFAGFNDIVSEIIKSNKL